MILLSLLKLSVGDAIIKTIYQSGFMEVTLCVELSRLNKKINRRLIWIIESEKLKAMSMGY